MNFAPYQDQSPDIERVLSPPHPDSRRISPILRSPRASADLPSPSRFAGGGHGNTGFGRDIEGGHVSLGAFETSLPIRMDIEAALAYLLLPPAGGVFLLLAEHKSDYVRFHAWQSSMLFATMFIIHLLFCWSSFLSWTLFIIDIVLIGFLSMHAYQDGEASKVSPQELSIQLSCSLAGKMDLVLTTLSLVDTLDHFEVPFFGHLANSFVDDE